MCEDMTSDELILDDEAVARCSHTNNIVWGPNVRQMRAVNEVSKVSLGRGAV